MTRDRLGDAREHLRYIEIGSAAMPLETKRKLMDLLPQTRICHHYGLTEASRAAFLEYHADRDHLASIGRPSPNVEMAVRDDDGRDLPDGQEGEIAVRGGMVMQQYWKQPELTRDALRGGWLRTGDRGYRDADGYYYLTGTARRRGECRRPEGQPGGSRAGPQRPSGRGRIGLCGHCRSARHRWASA